MRTFLALATVGVASATTARPLESVITLLKEMAAERELQSKKDDEVYKKFQCFCKKNRQEQTAKNEKAALDEKRELASKKKAELERESKSVEFEKTQEEYQSKTESLAELNEQCKNKEKEWSTDQSTTIQEITQLKGAINILKKHNFLQSEAKLVTPDVKEMLYTIASGSSGQKLGEAAPEKLATLLSFVRPGEMLGDSPTSFLQVAQPAGGNGVQSYANQSGQIYGILEQMLEDMERDYEIAINGHEELAKSCDDNAVNLENQKDTLASTKAALNERMSEVAKQAAEAQENMNIAIGDKNNSADFLADLNAKCAENEAHYQTRKAASIEEIKAIYDTVQILNNDEAFQAFGRTDTTKSQSFLQLKKSDEVTELNNEIRAKALESINKLAKKHAGTALVQYLLNAAQPDKGALAKVVEKIDLLIEELGAKQLEETALRQDCVDEQNRLTTALNDQNLAIETAEGLKTKANQDITSCNEKIAELEEISATTQKEMAENSANREEDAAAYKENHHNNQVALEVLGKAIARMSETYVAFTQRDTVEVAATATNAGSGPAQFDKAGDEQNQGGFNVLNMLKKIESDMSADIERFVGGENDAVSEYESYMSKSKADLEANAKAHAVQEGHLAQAQTDLLQAEKDLKVANDAKGSLLDEEEIRSTRCSFLQKNFDVRQANFKQEQEALASAKQILQEAI